MTTVSWFNENFESTNACVVRVSFRFLNKKLKSIIIFQSFPSALNLPTITTQSYDDLITGQGGQRAGGSEGSDEPPKHHTWTTMTPQEIATWIDKRSRILFPLLFIFFNIIYWTFVYCLWSWTFNISYLLYIDVSRWIDWPTEQFALWDFISDWVV